MKKFRQFIFTLLLVCTAQVFAQAESTWRVTEERWYSMEMFGSKAGWMSTISETDGSRFRTTTDTDIKISRGAIPIEINIASTFTETADGKPVSSQMKQKMSSQLMESAWEFAGDKVKITSRQGGRETTSEQSLPEGDWLTPRVAAQYARQQRLANAETITWRTIDPQNGVALITYTSTRKGSSVFKRDGNEIDVVVWSTKTDIVPVEMKEHFDAEGTMVHQETDMMGMGKMIMRLTTKAEAMGSNGAPLPEVLFQTFVTPDKPIDNVMDATKAKLRLTVKNGVMPPLPTAGAQRVEMSADGKSAVLTIDINRNVSASATDGENKPFREASAMIDMNDELIQKLAKRAMASAAGENAAERGPMHRAETLRQLARKHISRKGMETAFASASETAKMRTGDCSEHGVLLAALLRADGIPARVATGLVYADAFAGHEGIFGWHMWTQALIEGNWVDFDATLPKRYNAAHVLTSTSSLGDGSISSDMASIIQLIGNLEIEVLEIQYEELLADEN